MGADVVAMRWIAVAAGVLLVAGVLARSEEQAAEEESPLFYTLEVNGLPYTIKPGKLVTLPAQEGPLKVLLKGEPYQVLRVPGLEFRFPRGWQIKQLSKYEHWTLSMRGLIFSVSMERGERDGASVIEREIEWMRRLATKDDRIEVIRSERSLRIAGDNVAGTTYYSGRIGWVRTYYALRTGADTVLFTLTDLREGDEPSTEWKEMERWLQESLKVLPASDK